MPPKKTAKQMRLFQMRAERKRKRRDRRGPAAIAARRATPDASREVEPVQLDLIAHLEKLEGEN